MALSRDSIAVGIIVLAALAWAVRSIFRAVRAKRICSTCASSGGCPLAEGQTLQDLGGMPEVDRTPAGGAPPEAGAATGGEAKRTPRN